MNGPKGTQESGSEDFDTSSNEHYEDNDVEMVDGAGDKDIEDVMKFRQTLIRGVDENGKEIKYFKCALCEKESSDRSNIRRHMITQHTKPINQPCPFKCGKTFNNKFYLQKHINKKQCLQSKDESYLDAS